MLRVRMVFRTWCLYVDRTECFAAVLISIALTIHAQLDTTAWWPPRPPWPDSLLVLVAMGLRIVTILTNIVLLCEWLIVVLGSYTSVTLLGVTRLRGGRGVESCRRRSGLTFLLDTRETRVQ